MAAQKCFEIDLFTLHVEQYFLSARFIAYFSKIFHQVALLALWQEQTFISPPCAVFKLFYSKEASPRHTLLSASFSPTTHLSLGGCFNEAAACFNPHAPAISRRNLGQRHPKTGECRWLQRARGEASKLGIISQAPEPHEIPARMGSRWRHVDGPQCAYIVSSRVKRLSRAEG